jgi:DNA (cytosine-5)-methyltransferase 1
MTKFEHADKNTKNEMETSPTMASTGVASRSTGLMLDDDDGDEKISFKRHINIRRVTLSQEKSYQPSDDEESDVIDLSEETEDCYELGQDEKIQLAQQFTQSFDDWDDGELKLKDAELKPKFGSAKIENIDPYDIGAEFFEAVNWDEHEAKALQSSGSTETASDNQPLKRQKKIRKGQKLVQQTFSQLACFDSSYTTESVAHENVFKDTDDVQYLNVGGVKKVFKKNETFQTRLSGREGVYYTIREFRTKNCVKEAICVTSTHPDGVCIDLKNTFIGKEVEELYKSPTWSGRVHADKAICANPSRFLKSDDSIPLRLLTKKCNIPEPLQPPVIWDCDCEMKQSINFNFAYIVKPQTPLPFWVPRRKPVVLDLFAGCGGMSMGFEKAGFDVKYLVENNSSAAGTLRLNNPKSVIFEEDVNVFLKKADDPYYIGMYPQKGDYDHIHSSSPCQGFSDANRHGGKNDEKNNELAYVFVEAVRKALPPTASFENVTGMLGEKWGRRKYLQKIVARLRALDYNVRGCILRASDYGDPQKRERLFLFAALNDRKLPSVPPKTNVKVSFKEILRDLENVEPVEGNGLVRVPQGWVYDHGIDGTGLKSEKAESVHLSQHPDGVAPTVLRQKGIKHWSQPRDLTVRERARLQKLPDSHIFCGSASDRRNQIGNAVSVGLATAVAMSIMKSHDHRCK